MTVYILDSSSILVLQNYFPKTFPSFWEALDDLVDRDRVFSVRECYRELDARINQPHLTEWVERVKVIFRVPIAAETRFVAEIFTNPHFRQIIRQKQILAGDPVADPFVISAAKCHSACVVSEESMKPNAARIPNLCAHYNIDCTNIEGMFDRESWRF